MKILTSSEIASLSKLIRSDDIESRKLAITILRGKTFPITFHFTIAGFLVILSTWAGIELLIALPKAYAFLIIFSFMIVISIISLYISSCIISKKTTDEISKWIYDGND